MRILLAEDNEINQQLGIRLLKRQGHDVTLARDGAEALARYRAAPSAFDLILMDLQMPGMDGLEATAAIRRHEAQHGGRVPILALTAHFGPGALQVCLDRGMDGGVTKPLDMAEVDAAMTQATGSPAAEAPPPVAAARIGWEGALDLVLGDEALLRKMARLFLGQTDAMVGDIVDAHERGAAHDLERATHRLKGSVGNFGADEARILAGRMEDAAAAGDLAGAAALLDPLRAAVAGVRAALEARLAEPGA